MTSAHRQTVTIYALLLLLLLVYLVFSLPYLENFPIVEAAQMGIAAPAHKLAEQGVYGNDLYRGLFQSDQLNYEYMPLYPLTVAAAYKLWGLGVWQARLISVFCGLFVILLTFRLGKVLVGPTAGLLAAAILVLWPLTTHMPPTTLYPGHIPLIDLARVLRYDIMVPVWILAACLTFFWSCRQPRPWVFALTGLLVGLAGLTHLYGLFILPVMTLLLFWQAGRRGLQPWLWLLLGLGLAFSPWLFYINQDLAAYQGQMLRHESRFDLINPGFYLDNLLREPFRYLKFITDGDQLQLWPRPGLWLMVGSLIGATAVLWRRLWLNPSASYEHRLFDRFLFISLPLLGLQLALLMSLKRYTYIALLLPFLAIQMAFGIHLCWQWVDQRRPRWLQLLFVFLLGLVVVESLLGTSRNWQRARAMTPYLQLTDDLKEGLPASARILALHGYWLGLAEYDVLALDLAYNLSNPNFGGTTESELAAVIDNLAPNYIIVPEHLLLSYLSTEAAAAETAVNRWWRELDGYLGTHCALFNQVTDPAYLVINIYVCE